MFEEFYQVGNKERDRSKGLGLGLAIVERLAKLLDAPVHAPLAQGPRQPVRVRSAARRRLRSYPVVGTHRTGAGGATCRARSWWWSMTRS